MSPRPRIGVLALQGDVREHRAALDACGADALAVRRESELAEVDGLVLPGGESTTIGLLLERFGLLGPLQQAVADGLPVLGTCAGLVLLASRVEDGRPGQPTVGGLDAVVRRNAFGRQVDSFEADVELAGVVGGPVRGVFIRAPWVESVGEGVEVLAEHDGKVVAVRQGVVLATSFHPELTGDPRVHALLVDAVRTAGPRPGRRRREEHA